MRSLARAVTLAGFLTIAVAAPSHAATQIGQTFAPMNGCGSDSIWIQAYSPAGQYAAPTAGVITSWSYQAGPTGSPGVSPENPPQLRFKVVRQLSGNNWRIIGQSASVAPVASTLNTYPVQIPVQAGDVLGFYLPLGADIYGFWCSRSAADYGISGADTDLQPGDEALFAAPDDGLQMDLSAKLEADCDNDGLGDETQDTSLPLACQPVLPDTDPPETTITKQAPDETAKHKLKFKFLSDEAGSSFECKIDKKPFKACTSPKTVKHLDVGKHKFKVRAIDGAGNVDPTPAKDKFKVVD